MIFQCNKLKDYSNKELEMLNEGFNVLLNNLNLFRFTGSLCYWINECFSLKKLGLHQCKLLADYVYDNPPFLHKFKFSRFYWKRFELPPRLKYIDKHIKLIEKEQERRRRTISDVDL